MKTQKRTRLLSALMALLMVFSLLPASALAADETSTWEPIDFDKITADDVVAITMTNGTGTFALPTVGGGSNKQPLAVAATVEGDKLSIDGGKDAFGWNIVADETAGSFTLKCANGTLYIDAAGKNNGVRIGSTAAVFALSAEKYLTAADTDSAMRYVGIYNSTDWRAYTTINNNIKDQTLAFWKFVGETEPEPTEEPAEQTLLAVLDGAPADGDVVYLAHPDSGTVLTATASGTKLAGVEAQKAEDQLVLGETMAALTVAVKENVYTFSNDGKFLTSGETGNSLTFAEDGESDLAKWTLEQQTDGTWYLMNVGAAYQGNHNQALEYYSGFTTYGVKADNAAYKFAFYAVSAVDPVSGLKTGDTVAIFNDGNAKAMTATASGTRLAAADAALGTDGKLCGENIALFTVTVNEDGTLSFMVDGKYLTSGATGSSLTLEETANEYSLWVIEDAGDGLFFIKSANAQYNGNAQYLEYYSTFTTYGKKATADAKAYAMSFRQLAQSTEPEQPDGSTYGLVSKLADGDKVILFNAKNGVALGNTIANHKITGVALTPTDGVITTDSEAVVWTVAVNSDGTYTFKQGDYTLGGVVSGTYNNLVVTDAAFTSWTLTGPDSSDFNYFLRLDDMENNYGKTYLEYYNGFTLYGSSDPTKDAFGITFYKKGAAPETPSGEQPGGDVLKAGDKVVIYSAAAGGSLGLDDSGLNTSLGNIPTDVTEGTAYPANGAYVFTVGVEGEYYTFSAGGKYLATRNSEELFLADSLSDTGESCTYWKLDPRGDGYLINSKTARYNGSGVVCIEFFSGAFSGWTFKSADASIFIFNFYPLAEGVKTLDGVVNDPKVNFHVDEQPIKQQEYQVAFTLDDLTPLEKLTVTVSLNGQPVENLVNDGKNFSFVVPGAFTATADSLIITVQVANADGTSYFSDLSLPVQDIPIFDELTPAPGSKTGDDLMPRISVRVLNALDTDQATISIGGVEHSVPIHNGRISYTPTEPLKEGRVSVKVAVKRADGITGEQTWSFTVGVGGERLYFGQLHSHTTYSDGSGTLETALDYIKSIPESANVQFVAFTDHSNYFDTTSAANPEGALYDMSLASSAAQETWAKYRKTVADFNAAQSEVIAIAGFEMTWSGGPGHINTFNSPGFVSRNNSTLNNKTNDAGMKAYYALLDQPEGADTLSQFNHPGKTFGNFTDFSYWDAVTDSRMFMVEVGNGEGQIGAGGYYPSYEQYIMALDKGWHVAPTNNQDNHKGRWGNANDARDVILTDDFSEQGIYDAIRAMRMYATEDKNLEIYYTVNDQPLGSSLSEVPEKLDVNVQVSDPDSSDRITKVEVVVNSGKVVHTWDDAAAISSGALTATLAPDYSYYFIRVTESDGDLAVTAPVWVGETLKLGISAFESGTAMPVTGEELTLTTTLYNSEAAEASVKSVTYTANGSKVLGTDTKAYTVPASGTLEIPFKYTPDQARVMTVTVTVVMEQGGKEYTFTKDLTLDVQNADDLVYIGIDASHYNEYVSGNYKDSMGNFSALASGFGVRTVELKTSEELIAACGSAKFKAIILTAPSRRLAAAQADPKTYSADELAALVSFNKAGGMVVVAGWADNYENYEAVKDAKHMAATQNELLAALGSSMRLGDDEVVDDELNGGQPQRVYFDAFNTEHYLVDRVVVDPEHPNDRSYSEVYSNYGGCSVFFTGEGVPATVTPIVYGHATTYTKDCDGDGLNSLTYAYGDGSRVVVMASEQLEGRGEIIVSGAAFMSNFEVQAAASSGSSDADTQKNYANYKICENLVSTMNELKVSDISDVRAVTEDGFKFTIEGVVTSNASGYDKDTAFFDCIYVQDETAGICCFPVAGNFKVGDKVRITGTTDFYQGEPELQVISISLLGDGTPVTPEVVSAKAVMSREVEGKLITLKGTVERFELENGLVQTIMVKDAEGDVARVFIDGYITTAKDVENLAKGAEITVTGLASYDDTFNAPTGPFPRIRIRDRADVVVQASEPQHKCAVFKDIVGHWAQQDICYVVENDIMNGVDMEKGIFAPNGTTTRAMVVAVLYRLAGSPSVEGKTAFTDLTQKWYQDAVLWATQTGVTNGRSATTFAPDAAVTRAELVTFLMRYAKLTGADVTGRDDLKQFTDRGDVPAWALDAMQWAVKEGIISGMTPTTLVPGASSNRAQLATVLSRMMQKGA